MKKYLLAFILLLAMGAAFAQTKPKKQEKPPTQKEMEDMMKEMQKGVEEMSPEDKKMMDSLGIKMPTDQNLINQYNFANKNITQQQKKNISGIETIPVKDAARIVGIPKTILTNAQLLVFLQNVNTAVSKKISPTSKKIAEDAYQSIKKKYKETIYVANAANGLWIYGEPEAAIELMGRAVLENTSDPDNLNNYASFLTMNGGEHLALPILQKLNQRFPGNSTILNNIGQAWFGLGDMAKSEKYLDSTIHIFSNHSEANYTKCIIQESKGNKKEAISCIKRSIKGAYSDVKIIKLQKLGGKLQSGDIRWNFQKPQDVLGLDKMLANRPDFYYSKSQREELFPKWEEFEKGCNLLFEEYMPHMNENEIIASQTKMMNDFRSGKIPNFNFIMDKALELQKIVITDKEEFQNKMEKKSAYLHDSIMNVSTNLVEKVIEINEKWEKKFRDEIHANPPSGANEREQSENVEKIRKIFTEKACQESKPMIDDFHDTYNKKTYNLSVEWVSRMKYFTNEIIYYLRYSSPTEEDYQKSKNLHLIEFLSCISGKLPFFTTPVDFQYSCMACSEIASRSGICEDEPEIETHFQALSDFEIIHCDSHIKIWTPVAVARWDCNIQSVEMDVGILKLNHIENFIDGQTISATAEFGIYKSIGSKDLGPLKAELKAGGGGFIQWGPKGVSDFGLIAGVKAEVGLVDGLNPYGGLDPGGYDIMIKPGEPSDVVLGVEARIGWNSGPSLQGKGILEDLSIK
jgi:tetratricopeptide (TPR) repeat protein